jgi:transcriptional regulator with XRE-family HTH domain
VKALDSLFASWTTGEIAKELGVSEVSFRRWRYGQRRPQPSRIRQLAAVLARLRAGLVDPTTAEYSRAREDVHRALRDDAAART